MKTPSWVPCIYPGQAVVVMAVPVFMACRQVGPYRR